MYNGFNLVFFLIETVVVLFCSLKILFFFFFQRIRQLRQKYGLSLALKLKLTNPKAPYPVCARVCDLTSVKRKQQRYLFNDQSDLSKSSQKVRERERATVLLPCAAVAVEPWL